MEVSYSFVIPVYNTEEKYLLQCINSCLSQESTNVEVILVDDGSKEDCAIYCDAVSKHDNRVRVIHQRNAGVSAARNRGIEEAKGNWIVCIDSDDWADPALCEIIGREIEKDSGLDFILFSLAREYEGAAQPISGMYEDRRVFSDSEDIAHLQRDVLEHPLQNNILVFPYCKAVKREALQKAQPVFPEGIAMCEDVISAFKLFSYVKKGIYLDLPLYHYRQLSTSAVYQYRERAEVEQMQLLSWLQEMIQALPNPETYKKGYDREVLYAAQRVFSQKIYHKKSKISWRERRKVCSELFKKEPFKSGLKEVDVQGLSVNHRLKCFLLKYGMYELCACLYNIYYRLPGKNLN